MIKSLKLDLDGCQYFQNIFDPVIINDLNESIDKFIINEKIFHKFYHDPFHTNKKYKMIYSSQLDSMMGPRAKKSLIVINGKKCNKIMKSSFAILYPEHIFTEEINQIAKIGLIYLLLEKITKKKWYLENCHIAFQIACNESDDFDRKSYEKDIKMYVPLTDVKTLHDGPLMYIRYSHRQEKLPKHFPLALFPLKIGDFVLAYQNGLQKLGPLIGFRQRKVLILNFKLLESKKKGLTK